MSAGVIPCVRTKISRAKWQQSGEQVTISQTFPNGSGCGARVLLAPPRRSQFFNEREELEAGKSQMGASLDI
jgi:hypothetical protein